MSGEEAGASSLHTKESTAHLSDRLVSQPVGRLESVNRSLGHTLCHSHCLWFCHSHCMSLRHSQCLSLRHSGLSVALSFILSVGHSHCLSVCHSYTVCQSVSHKPSVSLSVALSRTLFVVLSLRSAACSRVRKGPFSHATLFQFLTRCSHGSSYATRLRYAHAQIPTPTQSDPAISPSCIVTLGEETLLALDMSDRLTNSVSDRLTERPTV